MPTLVSVIICTCNRARLLKRTLNALSSQTLRPDQFEIIVVDDGSRDHTAEVCERIRSRLPNLMCLSTGRNIGLGKARNVGIAASRGDALLFTDDDCIPRHDWVERLQSVLQEEQIVAGAIDSATSSYYKLCHNIAQFYPFMPGNEADYVDFIAGANMAFQRKVFEELGGFRHTNCAEDTHFILRARAAGKRIAYCPDAIVLHDPERTTLSDILPYAYKHAAATILLRNRYRFLLGTPFILRYPIMTVLAAPLIASKVTAGIYIKNRRLFKYIDTAPTIFALKIAWCFGAAKGLSQSQQPG